MATVPPPSSAAAAAAPPPPPPSSAVPPPIMPADRILENVNLEYEVRLQTVERVASSGRSISRVPAITMAAVDNIYQHMKTTHHSQKGTVRFMRLDISPQYNYRQMSLAPRLRVTLKDSDLQEFYLTKEIPKSAWNMREIKLAIHKVDLEGPLKRTVSAEIQLNENSSLPGGSADAQISSICQFYDHTRNENARSIRTDLRVLRELRIDSIGMRSNGKLGVVGRPNLTVSSRYIQRVSLHPNDGRIPTRMDISYVRKTANGTVPRATDHIPLSDIEVEVERTDDDRSAGWWWPIESMANEALTAILLVPPPYQGRETVAAALADYERFMKMTPYAHKALKPRPVIDNSELCGVNRMTDKADGVTAYFLVTPDGNTFIITSDGYSPNGKVVRTIEGARIFTSGARVPKDVSSTLLIGEYVIPRSVVRGKAEKPVFLVFDALVVGNVEQTSERLDDRLDSARRVVLYFAGGSALTSSRSQKRLARIASEGKELMPSRSPTSGHQWWPMLWMKKFDVVPSAAAVWVRDDLPYDTDGMILMSDRPLRSIGRTPPVVVKWKPMLQQTVDLLVYRTRNAGIQLLYMDRFDDAVGARYMFTPVGKSIATFDRTGPIAGLDDGVIAEFLTRHNALTPTKPGELMFVKVRADKTARYRNAMRRARWAMRREESRGQTGERRRIINHHERVHFGGRRIPDEWAGVCSKKRSWDFPGVANNRKVLLQTLEIAKLRVSKNDDEDRTEKRRFIDANVGYFDMRRKKTWLGQRQVDCNNLAKNLLMGHAFARTTTPQGYVHKGKNVLDLCCGEGNDMNRWNHLGENVDRFVGIDKFLCNVVEARRRTDLHYHKEFKKKASYHVGDMETLAKLRGVVPLGGFDVITVFFAIHYARKYLETLMCELQKWTAPGGQLIMTYMDSMSILHNMDGEHTFSGSGGNNFLIEKKGDLNWDVTIQGIGKPITEPRFNLAALQDAIGRSDLCGGAANATSSAPQPTSRWTVKRSGKLIDLREGGGAGIPATTASSKKTARKLKQIYEENVKPGIAGVSGPFKDTQEGKFVRCYDYIICRRKELFGVDDQNLNKEVGFSRTQRKHLPLFERALKYAELSMVGKDPATLNIFEPFASVGTDTIALALRYNRVVSIEYNNQKFNALKLNVNQSGYSNTKVVIRNANTIDVLAETSTYGDTFGPDREPHLAYVDAPWGGPDYYKKERVHIELAGSQGKKSLGWVVSNLPSSVMAVVLKVPPNFDARTFRRECPSFVPYACGDDDARGHFTPHDNLRLTRMVKRHTKGVLFIVLHRR